MKKTCNALLGILPALTMVVRILPMTVLAEETVNTDNDVTLDKSYDKFQNDHRWNQREQRVSERGHHRSQRWPCGYQRHPWQSRYHSWYRQLRHRKYQPAPKMGAGFFMGSLLYHMVTWGFRCVRTYRPVPRFISFPRA